MKIRNGCIVELTYTLRDSDGDVRESSEENGPMTYLHGYGEVPEGLERELDGVEEGAVLEIELAAGEAFGDHNPDGIIAVQRSEFPEDAEIVPGDWISVTVADDDAPEGEGQEIEMRVIEISPDAIVLDANHELAGQAVTFDVRVVSVREATAEEIAEREAAASEEEEEEEA